MKNRAAALLGTFAFFWIAPATIGGLVPWIITRWQMQLPLFDGPASRGFGALLVTAGLVIVVECFARFALKGVGTPAPIAPTKHLVVSGLYRHVRNPMYVGVVLAIAGQALYFGSTALIQYGAVVWVGFHAFVLGYEEPALKRQFGAPYETYCQHVPRWLPQLRPWRGP